MSQPLLSLTGGLGVRMGQDGTPSISATVTPVPEDTAFSANTVTKLGGPRLWEGTWTTPGGHGDWKPGIGGNKIIQVHLNMTE